MCMLSGNGRGLVVKRRFWFFADCVGLGFHADHLKSDTKNCEKRRNLHFSAFL